MDLYNYIESIQDYPQEGVVFRDITSLMADGGAFRHATCRIADYASQRGAELICGPEARGFIIGCPVAVELAKGFIPVRKAGKLPRPTQAVDYGLEYGEDRLEIHVDAIKEGQKVVIVDDLLATGGTVEATASLVEQLGGQVVGMAFLIELCHLKGREKIKNYDIFSLLRYDS